MSNQNVKLVVNMAALSSAGRSAGFLKTQLGVVSICYVQLSHYGTAVKKFNLASLKRGTGGRSSFNGIVCTVFGGSGFVGNYVCNRLGKTGTQLILPHRCEFYDIQRLKLVGDLGQVLFHEMDIRDDESLAKSMRYSNVVVNLIGRDYETKNFTFEDVHVTGARNIARIAREVGVERFIHFSYLNSDPNPTPTCTSTGSKYARTKYLGEQAVLEEFPDATIIKASDIYGEEDRFLKTYVHFWRRQGTWMPLWHSGEKTEKQPVFVNDVAAGVAAIVRDPDTAGKIYQFVGPKRYLLSELVDWFYRIMMRDAEWGYARYDLRYDPFFKLRVSISEMMSPAYPLGNLHWEGLEREHMTDIIKKDIPTLEDLGVKLTPMEARVPYEIRPWRLHRSYIDELGEFEKPAPPPTIPIV